MGNIELLLGAELFFVFAIDKRLQRIYIYSAQMSRITVFSRLFRPVGGEGVKDDNGIECIDKNTNILYIY